MEGIINDFKKVSNLTNLLERSGPLADANFDCSQPLLEGLNKIIKILVIGAGGLGCDILKDLALMGFGNIHVIDMDTIDLSNLNRQFLFQPSDIGKSKAEVAAKFINERIENVKVTPYFNKIQDFDSSFYSAFHLVVCGLDSVAARRWMNSLLVSLLEFDEEGNLDESSIIPLIDGGTEGFKGNVRVIIPGKTPCIECLLDFFPPQVTFPMCTIAHTPRLPEHCVEYVRVLLWKDKNPFGNDVPIDGDDHAHLEWILKKSLERAAEYNITGVDYRLVQGVVKRIIPAVASTNALIAAACASEAFKLATNCSPILDNFMNFNDVDGVYLNSFSAERLEDCVMCSVKPKSISFSSADKLESILQFLMDSYKMKAPSLTTTIDGVSKSLYLTKLPALFQATKANLNRTLMELNLRSGHELYVTDETVSKTLIFKLLLTCAQSLFNLKDCMLTPKGKDYEKMKVYRE